MSKGKVPVENPLVRKLHFEPSTIETIDSSVLKYFESLDLFSDTNEGWKKVPIVWGTAERAYQVKKNKDIREILLLLLFTGCVATHNSCDKETKKCCKKQEAK